MSFFCIYLFNFHLSSNTLEYYKLKRDSFYGQFDVIFSYEFTFRYIVCVHVQEFTYINIFKFMLKTCFHLQPNMCEKHSIHFSLSTYMVFVLFSYLTTKMNSANSKIIFKIFIHVRFIFTLSNPLKG